MTAHVLDEHERHDEEDEDDDALRREEEAHDVRVRQQRRPPLLADDVTPLVGRQQCRDRCLRHCKNKHTLNNHWYLHTLKAHADVYSEIYASTSDQSQSKCLFLWCKSILRRFNNARSLHELHSTSRACHHTLAFTQPDPVQLHLKTTCTR